MLSRFLIVLLLSAPVFSPAAIIVKIKGNRCFVDLEGAGGAVGDHFQALDLFGKTRGIIRLDKVKNGKAIATIVSGAAGRNWILEHTTQTKLESPETAGSKTKNKAGILASGSRITVKKDIRETERYHGWGSGGLLFFDWSFHKRVSLHAAGGVFYYIIGSQSSEGGLRSYGARNIEDLRMTGFPHLQLALKFHIPLAGQTNLWVQAGMAFSQWNNINDQYYMIAKSQFKFQPSGQIMLGMDINVPNTKYTIPVSVGYSKVQWGGQWFDEHVLGKKAKTDQVTLDISENVIFQIGVSQHL